MNRLLSTTVLSIACLTSACSRPAAAPAIAEPRPPETEPNGVVLFEPDSPMLKAIARAPVAIRDLPTDEIVAAGKIEANPNKLSKIVLPVTGRIAQVLVHIGDSVRAGQPLFTIQSPDGDAATSSYLSAQAALTQAEAALGKAQADADRERDLFSHNAVAQKDVLTAESALAQAKASVEQSRAALEQATRHLSVLGLKPGDFQQPVVVSSPLTGKVLDLSVVPGEYRTDQTTPVTTVADLSTVWVTSQVPESYIRFVQIGERVDISLVAYPGETFEGRVSRISDTLDPQTRTVKVQAEVDNRGERFRPEMYGSIHHVESTASIAVVPPGAVMQLEGRSVVYVETAPGRFAPRPVTVGRPAGDVVRITKGLSEGERIVVDGTMLMRGLSAARRAGA